MAALVEYSAGNYSESASHLKESETAGDEFWKTNARDYQGRLAVDTRRDDEALKILTDGARSDDRLGYRSSQGQKFLSIAGIHLRAGRLAETRSACLRAIDLDSGPTRVLYAGALLARAHFVRQAKELYARIDSSIDVPLFRQARKKLQGEILLAQQQIAGALAAFREAAQDSPRVLGREFLARACAQAGAKKEALDLYVETLAAKTVVWMVTDPEPAGTWIDSLNAAVRLAGETHDPRLPELSAQWMKTKPNK
jgi:tetratricopeptide (TPR) repeat protein